MISYKIFALKGFYFSTPILELRKLNMLEIHQFGYRIEPDQAPSPQQPKEQAWDIILDTWEPL